MSASWMHAAGYGNVFCYLCSAICSSRIVTGATTLLLHAHDVHMVLRLMAELSDEVSCASVSLQCCEWDVLLYSSNSPYTYIWRFCQRGTCVNQNCWCKNVVSHFIENFDRTRDRTVVLSGLDRTISNLCVNMAVTVSYESYKGFPAKTKSLFTRSPKRFGNWLRVWFSHGKSKTI